MGAMGESGQSRRDRPWLMRTYAGHSSARASNALYRANLERGQTGLSIAFDLPTQTGYDADEASACGEVGRVGVPVSHLGDMETLFEGIPIERMNTSMTINATAAWLFALYIALADKRGVPRASLAGTVQNDIVKEYLSRGTYIFPPAPSLKLTTDVVAFSLAETPRWNPINVCPYHLQEAGATPVQEIAFSLANAIQVLDDVKASGAAGADMAPAVGRMSFFVNAGIRFVTEMCKMRAFAELWDEIALQRYGVADPKLRRFRYGVQVNSLGLTEQQPENNVYRILLETLAVTLSRSARARAVQLPAWNEALGLPRPWDQQWSLRLQQILAFETDLLEYGDIFDGSREIAARTAALKQAARAEMAVIEGQGGALRAVENGYMKQALVASAAARLAAIEAGEMPVVGVNMFTDTAPSPLTQGEDGGFLAVAPAAEDEQIAHLKAWRASRDGTAVAAALDELGRAAREGRNVMAASIACARAGATTGEWGRVLRRAFGEYRAPTGLAASHSPPSPQALARARAEVEAASRTLGRRLKLLVGKPGLDGHSNGAEQIALAARHCGMEVVYQGIRLAPEQIAASALEESVHVVGLSILSGAHIRLAGEVRRLMDAEGLDAIPIVVGGTVPPADAERLRENGIAAVFTPKDFEVTAILCDIARIAAAPARGDAPAGRAQAAPPAREA